METLAMEEENQEEEELDEVKSNTRRGLD